MKVKMILRVMVMREEVVIVYLSLYISGVRKAGVLTFLVCNTGSADVVLITPALDIAV